MSRKKSKGVMLDSTPPFGVGVNQDAKARLKHQTLIQDYDELQKEGDVIRSKLEAAKQTKLMLLAEVRFLRRRREYLATSTNPNSSQDQILPQEGSLRKKAKLTKDPISNKKEASKRKSPLIPQPTPKKKNYTGKRVALFDAPEATDQARKKRLHVGEEASDFNHTGRIHIRKEPLASSLDKDHTERMISKTDAALGKSIAAFDLNLDTNPSGREFFIDLNQISTGDEDIPGNVEALKFEEAKMSLMKGINDEQQNDLTLSICRNAGEGSSRVGKRRISWQDPVALRV